MPRTALEATLRARPIQDPTASLRGLLEFTRLHPKFTPLILCEKEGLASADRIGVAAIEWREFLLSGPLTGKR